MYLDDILVASPDRLSQAHHLHCVLQRLQDNGLVLNKAKCEFFWGLRWIPEQLAAVGDFPQPSTVKELQVFLGAVNFFWRFIPAWQRFSYPSPPSSRATKRGPMSWNGGAPMLDAFKNIKAALMRSVCVACPSDTAEISLATDASATHVGAVLQQREGPNSDWRPLGFFSAKLETAQLLYSVFARELYGIFAGIRHFRHHLEGRDFTVWTDHKPLTFALSRMSDSWTA